VSFKDDDDDGTEEDVEGDAFSVDPNDKVRL